MLNLNRWQDLCGTRFAGFMVFLWKRFDEVRVPQVSASLTFTTLLALVPVLTVTLVVVSAFPMFDTLSDSFVRFINQTIVPQGAGVLFDYINQFKGKASNLTAIGIVMLVVTSLLLIRTIDQTFNRIWRVQSERPLWTQFLVYWALLTFGPLAIGLSLTAWTLMLQQSRVDEMFPFLTGVLRTGSSILFSTVILWLLYRLVPNRYVPARQALVGAAVTAVLLEAARALYAELGFTEIPPYYHNPVSGSHYLKADIG